MMVRLFSLLLCLSVLTACGGQSAGQEKPDPAPAATTGSFYEDISAEEFAGRIGAPNTVILDVRTPGETANGIIEGAIELDFRAPDFAEKVAALDKDKTYLVYCASGGRSGKTCRMMQEAGFGEVYNLIGGYRGWKQ